MELPTVAGMVTVSASSVKMATLLCLQCVHLHGPPLNMCSSYFKVRTLLKVRVLYVHCFVVAVPVIKKFYAVEVCEFYIADNTLLILPLSKLWM